MAMVVSLGATACHKHDVENIDPVISLLTPSVDASVAGDVAIAGLVTDESLHELTIKVTKDSDNSELFNSTPEVHDLTSYTIAELWTPSGIAAETAVTLTITAEDHNSNIATATVKFKVKP